LYYFFTIIFFFYFQFFDKKKKVFPKTFIFTKKQNNEIEIEPARDLFTVENLKKFEKPWHEKVPIAFFRGTATGFYFYSFNFFYIQYSYMVGIHTYSIFYEKKLY
jgi:hypothetical protein